MNRISWILPATTLFLTACASSVGIGNTGVDHLASTRIKTSSGSTIRKATDSVFRGEGFSVISSTNSSVTFSKVGGRSADIAWKTIGNDNPVLIQPTVTWRPDGAGMTWVGCSVEVVQRSDAFGSSVRKPLLAGKAAYSGLLKQVKHRVENGR